VKCIHNSCFLVEKNKTNKKMLLRIVESAAFPKYRILPAQRLKGKFFTQEFEYIIEGNEDVYPKPIASSIGERVRVRCGIADFSSSIETSETCVIHCHGNVSFIDSVELFSDYLKITSMLKCPIVGFDYPGRGGAVPDQDQAVRPTERLLYQSAIGVAKTIMDKYPNIKNFFIWGVSLGTVAACAIVDRFLEQDYEQKYGKRIRGVILQSGFTSARDLAPASLCGFFVDSNWFSNVRKIQKNQSRWPPTTIYHGGVDKDINCSHSVELFKELIPEDDFRLWVNPVVGDQVNEDSDNQPSQPCLQHEQQKKHISFRYVTVERLGESVDHQIVIFSWRDHRTIEFADLEQTLLPWMKHVLAQPRVFPATNPRLAVLT
jgi:hypothetical protein